MTEVLLHVLHVDQGEKLVFAVFPWTLIVRVQNMLGVGMKGSGRAAK